MRYALALLAFVLILGCIQNQPAAPNATQNQPPQQNASGQNAPEQQPYIPPANPAPQAPSQNAYPGKDFASLAALGIPLECDITYIYQGRSFQAKVYMKGGSDIRVETIGGSGLSQCVKIISIVQASKVYVGCENKTVIPSCDWFTSGYNPQVPGQSSTFDFSRTPPEQISCSDWVYDQSYFSTAGRTCSLGG